MLKRIEARQVRTGMFVEMVEGIWRDPLLLRRRFLLRYERDTLKLNECGETGVVINTSKGVDVVDSARKIEIDVKAARETIQKSVEVLEDVFGRLQGGEGVTIEQVEPVI